MKEETNPRTYFWAYDIFGYLLPGLGLVGGLLVGTTELRGRVGPQATAGVASVVLLLLVAYVVGHVVAALSGLLLERAVIAMWLGYPTYHMFRKDGHAAGALSRAFGYFRPYSRPFKRELMRRFTEEFGVEEPDDNDLFWLSWSYISLHHPAAFKRGTHFLDLYGLSRNLSMACLLIAGLPLLPDWSAVLPAAMWSSAFAGSALLLFLNYVKLLRRLNDEVYRGFLAHKMSAGKELPVQAAQR